MAARYYFDLNPAWKAGDRYEKRWVVIDGKTGRVVPRVLAPQYAGKRAAEKAAKRLNDLEALIRES
jgi:DNA-binding beta-propeller fold protein YncE